MEGNPRNAVALGEGGGPRVEDVGDYAVGAVGEEEAFKVRFEAAEGGEEFGSDIWDGMAGEIFGELDRFVGGEGDG
ncbi:hypothetical protein IEQ34_004420 [Dendrobium chrysotoxum]|uniref:Uncharacterized protein n=1 Tax=Dendrobium chrysotoxum TaxID=161865 RepID=A0AAV7HFU0_DENCH|nr:hypothetical protein IEQ34_004420 [Dendrobium chrysotoxum]